MTGIDLTGWTKDSKPAQQSYQGWTNRETWCVNLWLTNTESDYLTLVRLGQRFGHAEVLARVIHRKVSHHVWECDRDMRKDLKPGLLRNVNWLEIARSVLEW